MKAFFEAVREGGEPGTLQCLDMELFFKAIEEGDEGEVTRLLGADAELLEKTDNQGARPLLVAAVNRHLGVVKLLIRRGADVNARGPGGITALHGAACGDDEEMVAFLLEQGAQANSTMHGDRTPLKLACHEGQLAVVHMLLQHIGTQVLEETDEEGWRALHWVAYRGHEAVATLLLEQGAQANSRDASDRTPSCWPVSRVTWAWWGCFYGTWEDRR
jgi:ankyrin repeat protein